MQPIPLNYGTGSAPGAEPEEGGPIFTNCYAEISEGEDKSQVKIHATEGRNVFTTISQTGPCRALFVENGELYSVVGRNVAKTDIAGNSTILGGLSSDGQATFSVNNAGQITVTSGGLNKVIVSGTMTDITDGDLPPAIDNVFLDGYTVYTIEDGRLFASELQDSDDIDALDYATAEGSPDKNVRTVVRGRELWVFGKKSKEIMVNDAGTNFPFSPIAGAFESVGCLAAESVIVVEGAPGTPVVWVDNNGIVKAAQRYTGQRISNHDVERSIRKDARKSEIRAMTYVRDGHVFYGITGSDYTWVYDFATGRWHNRKSYGYAYSRASKAVRFNDKIIVGDTENGSLYELDPDTYLDGTDHLILTVRFPAAHKYPHRLRINGLYLDPLPGRGLNSTDAHNADPNLIMRLSKDGGHTFSQERHIPIGKKGEFQKRVKETRWGVCGEDGAILEASVSAAIVRGFVASGALDVDVLAA